MTREVLLKLAEDFPIVKDLRSETPAAWVNPNRAEFHNLPDLPLTQRDIDDAEQRLSRFAPFLMKCFPETQPRQGIIESDLVPIPSMQEALRKDYGCNLQGKLLLKKDSHLAIVGSVKARGGIYEVLKHSEDLALSHGLLREDESYEKLASPELRDFFSRYTMQVGSTGNLGMSIGIMSAALGYQVIVHMSADAKQWKKDLLRSRGVQVIEYEADYGAAVDQGRKQSDQDPMSYFVDDEHSKDLFLGYSVAAKRLPQQLAALGIQVDQDHPLFVYIPCGIGGAPGGISFGLKQAYRDNVHCFFVEPTQAPCMVLGMATGLNDGISVQDIGLTGLTQADGLAVGRPSSFVGELMKPLLSGAFTVPDADLYRYMRTLWSTEQIFLEPSACASFQGPLLLQEKCAAYLHTHQLTDKMPSATHIVWGTGGSLVPEAVRTDYLTQPILEKATELAGFSAGSQKKA